MHHPSQLSAVLHQGVSVEDLASTREAQIFRERQLHEALHDRRKELRVAEATRRRVEARLAKELAFRERLHTNLSLAKKRAESSSEREWVEVLEAYRALAESEAAKMETEMNAVLTEARTERQTRLAYSSLMALSNDTMGPMLGKRLVCANTVLASSSASCAARSAAVAEEAARPAAAEAAAEAKAFLNDGGMELDDLQDLAPTVQSRSQSADRGLRITQRREGQAQLLGTPAAVEDQNGS